jgi:hypothetical protein
LERCFRHIPPEGMRQFYLVTFSCRELSSLSKTAQLES